MVRIEAPGYMVLRAVPRAIHGLVNSKTFSRADRVFVRLDLLGGLR